MMLESSAFSSSVSPGNAPGADEPRLRIDPRTIRHMASRHAPGRLLPVIVARQLCGETVARGVKRIRFRSRQNAEACAAYCEMSVDEFSTINSRQAWANWRAIPRSLDGRLPDRPVSVIDLCCGVGDSTAVLAHYCPPGSRILGLEYNPEFVEAARRRAPHDPHLRGQRIEFNAQSVLETFRDSEARPVPDESIDLINASGAVGCHFDHQAVRDLARECARVTCPNGLATIDAHGEPAFREMVIDAFADLAFRLIHQTRSCVFDRYRHLCLRKGAEANGQTRADG